MESIWTLLFDTFCSAALPNLQDLGHVLFHDLFPVAPFFCQRKTPDKNAPGENIDRFKRSDYATNTYHIYIYIYNII